MSEQEIPPRPWKNEHGIIKDANGQWITNLGREKETLANHIVKAVNTMQPHQTPGMCVVCGAEPVDAESGFDTCKWCTRRI